MSNRILTKAWNARGLTPAQKIVLVRLADRADNDGYCFPGHQSIADDCGLTTRTVRDTLPEIAAKGHLTIKEESQRAFARNSRFSYIVHPVTPENASPVTPENGAVDTGMRSALHRNNGTLTPENGAVPILTSPNPHLNHQGNQRPRLENAAGWQIAKDRQALKDQIREAKQSAKPDTALINGLRAELAEINQEFRRRGASSPASGTKATAADVPASTMGDAQPGLPARVAIPVEITPEQAEDWGRQLREAVNGKTTSKTPLTIKPEP